MGSSREVTRTEQRIAEVDAMQQTVEQLQQDLQKYRTGLRQELAALKLKTTPAPQPAPAGREPPRPTPARVPLPPRPVEPVTLEPEEDEEDAAAGGALDEGFFRQLTGNDDREELRASAEFDVGAPPPQPSPFEDDGSDRIGGKPVSVLISDGTATEDPLSGWVIDRPPGGLKILVDEQLQVGMVIGVRPSREHPHAQWINCSIKAIKPERSSFILTCTFVNRPPWNALALLNN